MTNRFKNLIFNKKEIFIIYRVFLHLIYLEIRWVINHVSPTARIPMTPIEAIRSRQSIRTYKDISLEKEDYSMLLEEVISINKESGLSIQLVADEPKAFKGLASYGKFSGVNCYLVMAGPQGGDLEERIGYYGEKLILKAQTMGIDSCWVGLTYKKIPGAFTLEEEDRIVCMIALGYGSENGRKHKIKRADQVSNLTSGTPDWFCKGIDAALLAPTAVNQQKWYLEYIQSEDPSKKPLVRATRRFSLAGYTKVDLGIVKCHFEIGAGKENFNWA